MKRAGNLILRVLLVAVFIIFCKYADFVSIYQGRMTGNYHKITAQTIFPILLPFIISFALQICIAFVFCIRAASPGRAVLYHSLVLLLVVGARTYMTLYSITIDAPLSWVLQYWAHVVPVFILMHGVVQLCAARMIKQANKCRNRTV